MNFKRLLSLATAISGACVALMGETPIPEILTKLDPATGKSKDTQTAFALQGIVSARVLLPLGKVIAFVQPVSAPGIAVSAEGEEARRLFPRNEVKLTGTFKASSLGFDALEAKPGSISVAATNKPFGLSEPRGAAFFADASSLAGRYVSLTNVTLKPGKFDGSARWMAAEGAVEVPLLVSVSIKDRDVPTGPLSVFGVPVRLEKGWGLVASRFVPATSRTAQALAAKHTCLTCHNPDTKVVGPPYRDVAARYKDDASASEKLMLQMEKGGTGKWGALPMPPLGAKVPVEDRKVLAEWIMSYRWDALLGD